MRAKILSAVGAISLVASGLVTTAVLASPAIISNICLLQNPERIAIQYDGTTDASNWDAWVTQDNYSSYFTGSCPSFDAMVGEVANDNAPNFELKAGRGSAYYDTTFQTWDYRDATTGELLTGLHISSAFPSDGFYGLGTWIPSPFIEYSLDFPTGTTTCSGPCLDNYEWKFARNTVVKNTSSISAHVRRSKSGKWIRISVLVDRNQCSLNSAYTEGATCTPARAFKTDRVVIRRNGKYAGSFKINSSGFGKMWVKEPKGKQNYTVTVLESSQSFSATKAFVR